MPVIAIADSCVAYHNAHPTSPTKDFKSLMSWGHCRAFQEVAPALRETQEYGVRASV